MSPRERVANAINGLNGPPHVLTWTRAADSLPSCPLVPGMISFRIAMKETRNQSRNHKAPGFTRGITSTWKYNGFLQPTEPRTRGEAVLSWGSGLRRVACKEWDSGRPLSEESKTTKTSMKDWGRCGFKKQAMCVDTK